MILPINENTDIISYTYHTYSNAIIDQNNQGLYVDMIVKDGSKRDWYKFEQETKFRWEKDELFVEGHPYAAHTDSAIWRKCSKQDEIEIEVKHFHYSNTESIINLFITNEDATNGIKNHKQIYKLGKVRRYGLIIRLADNIMPRNYSGEFSRMKLKRDGNKITSYVYVENDWLEVDSRLFPKELSENNVQIGINVDMGEDQYYNWLFMNYLQLYFNKNDDNIQLDYYMFPRKNYSFLYDMQFLNDYKFSEEEVNAFFKGPNKCIRWSLEHKRYPVVNLDEYYAKGSTVYQKEHKCHGDMVYGYDDEKQEYIMLGFDVRSITLHVPYDVIDEAVHLDTGIKVMEYYSNVNPIKFNLQNFMMIFGDYVHSYPTSYRLCNLMGITEDTFGLDIFKDIMESEKGQYYLKTDIRLVYVFYEYNRIMQKRLDFLEYRGYLKSNIEEIKKQCHELLKYNTVIINSFIINQRKGDTDLNKKLNCIKKLYKMQKEFSNLLYDSLMIDNKDILSNVSF